MPPPSHPGAAVTSLDEYVALLGREEVRDKDHAVAHEELPILVERDLVEWAHGGGVAVGGVHPKVVGTGIGSVELLELRRHGHRSPREGDCVGQRGLGQSPGVHAVEEHQAAGARPAVAGEARVGARCGISGPVAGRGHRALAWACHHCLPPARLDHDGLRHLDHAPDKQAAVDQRSRFQLAVLVISHVALHRTPPAADRDIAEMA
mmetsp:Transcript_12784/g.38007  ORF Transcript_12784/g.38007 Transcript_12784/m.38007 type:complete len:206 (-) Transcript_12784:8-625(-)